MGSSRGCSAERGFRQGSSRGFQRTKGFQQGFQHLCFTIVFLHFSPDAFVGPLRRLDQGCSGCRGHSGLCQPRWLGLHRPHRPPQHQGGDPPGHQHCPHPLHPPPLRRREAALRPHRLATRGPRGQPPGADLASHAARRRHG